MMSELVAIPTTLITTYLEMNHMEQFRASYATELAGVQIMQAHKPDIDFYRFLYRAVGYHLRWRDRLLMPDADLQAILDSDDTRVDVLYVDGVPAGYCELERRGHDIEIAFFGLRHSYQGKGLGKHLLSTGIANAWAWGAKRVWVHTCNMDGEHALENYLKRGFTVYRVEEEPLPDRYRT
jgi:GNAT superfamily N-acetyltransferase